MRTTLLLLMLLGLAGCETNKPRVEGSQSLPASAMTRIEINDFQARYQTIEMKLQQRLESSETKLRTSLESPTVKPQAFGHVRLGQPGTN